MTEGSAHAQPALAQEPAAFALVQAPKMPWGSRIPTAYSRHSSRTERRRHQAFAFAVLASFYARFSKRVGVS